MRGVFIAIAAVLSVIALVSMFVASYYYLVKLPEQQVEYSSYEQEAVDLKNSIEKNNNPAVQKQNKTDVYNQLLKKETISFKFYLI